MSQATADRLDQARGKVVETSVGFAGENQ